MIKVIDKNVAEIIVVAIFAIMFLSSCQTIKEINMTSGQRATQCNWVNYK